MKRAAPHRWNNDAPQGQSHLEMQTVICPKCRGAMTCLGKKFTPPKRSDEAQWKKLEWMIQNGWRGYNWPTRPEMTLREVQESLATTQQHQNRAANREKTRESLEQVQKSSRARSVLTGVARRRQRLELKRQREYQERVLAEVASENEKIQSQLETEEKQ